MIETKMLKEMIKPYYLDRYLTDQNENKKVRKNIEKQVTSTSFDHLKFKSITSLISLNYYRRQ